MAQLNSRGTQTRTRWDFYEHSNGVAFVWGQVAAGPIGAYFVNNSTGSTSLDIYTINWSASVAAPWTLGFLLPPLVLTPLVPTESHIYALTPDTAQPPGLIGMYTANAGVYQTLEMFLPNTQGAQMAPIMGSFFATLPPGWALVIGGFGGGAACQLAMTIWYQYVLDNVSPAV